MRHIQQGGGAQMLTIERLKAVVSYCPETGAFRRIGASKWHQRCLGNVITTVDSLGYIVLKIDGKMYKAHRLAWFYMTGEWPASTVDHINRERADNRWRNLRAATVKQQNENRGRQKNNRSGSVGVVWYPRAKKWRATICHNRENIYLGEFGTFELACAARAEAVERLFTHCALPIKPPAST